MTKTDNNQLLIIIFSILQEQFCLKWLELILKDKICFCFLNLSKLLILKSKKCNFGQAIGYKAHLP